MNLEQVPSNASPQRLPHSSSDTLLSGGWLIVARVAWGTVVTLVLGLLVVSLPGYLSYLQIICVHQPCLYQQLTLNSARSLQALGISVEGYTVFTLALTLFAAMVWMVMSGVLVWRRSNDWMALLIAFMLVVGGADNSLYGGYTTSQGQWGVPANLLGFLFSLTLFVVFSLFPSGYFVPRWIRWLIPAFLLNNFLYQFFPNWYAHLPAWADFLGLLDFVGSFLLLLLAQIYRYWRVSSVVQRQQTRWILFSITLGIVFFLGWGLLENLIPSLNGSLYDPLNAYLNDLGSLLFPVAFAIAITRYRLWDIDIIINRALVYGSLSACIVGLYIFVMGYLGALFRTSNNLLISLIATSLVAILFQPLRGWLQRGVNRLFYGRRDEPYTVITRLSQRLEGALAPEAILSTIVETVAQALKLPYAAILLKREDVFAIAADYGKPANDSLKLPLAYQGEVIGQLQLAPRAPGEAFTPADQRLLDELARQASLATHAVRLTADLQRSRERLVQAREEERRRLRRDLHDGLGATLAALHLQAGAIRTLMRQDMNAAETELLDLQAEIRSAVADIRRLVYALRPPALDELGLIGAIRQFAEQYNSQESSATETGKNLRVVVEAPEQLPILSAAIEVAVYRVVQEALTNVVRHARAQSCLIRLSLDEDSELQVEIIDDGIGLPEEPRAGVGLISMRERAEEVGGSCVIKSMPGKGTHVLVRLPITKE
ncbi:MAG TPA: ATP-binding protein [Ktedonobacteraceae bacterium]|jgi:signal transduction histidine kinase|nr:ATP-binding protein [Ktedonobacteraceae bacterium]